MIDGFAWSAINYRVEVLLSTNAWPSVGLLPKNASEAELPRQSYKHQGPSSTPRCIITILDRLASDDVAVNQHRLLIAEVHNILHDFLGARVCRRCTPTFVALELHHHRVCIGSICIELCHGVRLQAVLLPVFCDQWHVGGEVVFLVEG